ncbi:MAG TPA: hypothetical protein VMG12_19930 [Polyangiaceae bacterium]|nr:hypothetical protein [Polyangiaceae bacterium]
MPELWSRPLPIALVALAALAIMVWLPRHGVRAKSWALFRCLLPSWRFFEQIERVPALRYRVAARVEGEPHDDWSDWHDALSAPRRPLSSLWLNADGNLHLASRSLIEHLVADLEALDELGQAAEQLVSYRLVCALVERRVRAALPEAALRYQFCLVDAEVEAELEVDAEAVDASGQRPTPLFLSSVHGPA